MVVFYTNPGDTPTISNPINIDSFSPLIYQINNRKNHRNTRKKQYHRARQNNRRIHGIKRKKMKNNLTKSIQYIVIASLIFSIYIKITHDVINTFSVASLPQSCYTGILIIFVFIMANYLSRDVMYKVAELINRNRYYTEEESQIITAKLNKTEYREKEIYQEDSPLVDLPKFHSKAVIYGGKKEGKTEALLHFTKQIKNDLTNVYLTKQNLKIIEEKSKEIKPFKLFIKTIEENENIEKIIQEVMLITGGNSNILIDSSISINKQKINKISQEISGILIIAIDEKSNEIMHHFDTVIEISKNLMTLEKNRFGETGKSYRITI